MSVMSEELSDDYVFSYVWDVGLPMGAALDMYESSSEEDCSDVEYCSDSNVEREKRKTVTHIRWMSIKALPTFLDMANRRINSKKISSTKNRRIHLLQAK